ncbi:hypothetical protein [Methylobacterium sp. E-005]|nr:hypothetical protein [Methylobacterium sp. E-005]
MRDSGNPIIRALFRAATGRPQDVVIQISAAQALTASSKDFFD